MPLAVVLSPGRRWLHGRVIKPFVTEQNGEPTIHLPPPDSGSTTGCLAYSLIQWHYTAPAGDDGGRPDATSTWPPRQAWQGMSTLERERSVVSETLRIYADVRSKDAAAESTLWNTRLTAQHDQMLDAEIYLPLMDRGLASSYSAYRDAHRDQLIQVVTRILSSVPPPASRQV